MKRKLFVLALSLILTSAAMATGSGRGGGAVDFTLVWVLGGAFITARMFRRKR